MRVVVCTIVHHPADARIYHRQIRALLDAGHEVRYIAPVGTQERCPDRSAEASLCQFVSVYPLPCRPWRSKYVQRRRQMGEAGQ
jgi:hypothetical protein